MAVLKGTATRRVKNHVAGRGRALPNYPCEWANIAAFRAKRTFADESTQYPESDDVALGRLIDQTSYARRDKAIQLEATAPDGTPLVGKLDGANLHEGVLHETKKSRAVEEAHRWQVRFYLWLLGRCGVTRADGTPFTGQIDYPRLRRTEPVELLPEHEARLAEIVASLRELATQPTPPPRLTRRRFCARCAFEELCYG